MRRRYTASHISSLIVYFAVILVGYVFVCTDSEYNLNQQIARGYISRNSLFFEIYNPSYKTARTGNMVFDSDGYIVSSTGNLAFTEDESGELTLDNSPIEGENPEYVLVNEELESGLTEVETMLSCYDGEYFAALHSGKIRGVYFSGEVNLPPITEGRFLEAEECLRRDKLAVIGRNYCDSVYVKDGVSYIEIMGKEYVVIGITAMAGESALDDMLFVNIGSLSREEQIQNMFYIDMCDDTDKAYAEMDLLAQSLLGTSLSKREMPTALIDVVSGGMYMKDYLKVLSAFLLIFTMINILVQFIRRSKFKTAVMKMEGVDFIRIFSAVNKQLFLCETVGMLIGVVTVAIMIKCSVFVLPYETLIKNLTLFICVDVVLFVISALIIGIYERNVSVSEEIRTV